MRSDAAMDAISRDASRDAGSAGTVRAIALFHKIEIVCVVGLLATTTWGIVRAGSDLWILAAVWLAACAAAARVSLWPGAPRGLVLFAEAALLAVAIGHWIAPHHDVLPILGREIRDLERWNLMPLTQRRVIAWNVIAGVTLAWLMLPYAFWHMQRSHGSQEPAIGVAVPREIQMLIFGVIWLLLVPVLYQAIKLLLT